MTKEKMLKMMEVAKRADEMNLLISDRMNFVMDLKVADKYFELDLDRLLTVDDSDLIHDVLGIQKNINRESMIIENQFLPRITKK